MSDYELIGGSYASTRRPDPRIAAKIREALGDVRTVVNIGAGTGSYEPTDLDVTAVEPSRRMIEQRPPGAARIVQASAERLPFEDDSFDASLAVLSTHHWLDWKAGIDEMRRVARTRVVVFTWDPMASRGFWLHEYVPHLTKYDAARFFSMKQLQARLGVCRIEPVRIPHDCTDGFLGCYWQRPHAYLEADVRRGMSSFTLAGVEDEVEAGMARLAEDLESGDWTARWGHLKEIDALDLGYRLAIAELDADQTS